MSAEPGGHPGSSLKEPAAANAIPAAALSTAAYPNQTNAAPAQAAPCCQRPLWLSSSPMIFSKGGD